MKEGITVYKGYRVIKLFGVPLIIAIAISLVWGGVAYAGGRSSTVERSQFAERQE